MSRALTAILILIALLALSQTRTPLYTTVEYDPPSIFNQGPGGISIFYIQEMCKHKTEIIYSVETLQHYEPDEHILLIIGPDTEVEMYERVLEWVGRGGIVAVMDELNYTAPLLSSTGIQQGPLYRAIAAGKCAIGNATVDVLFNVYRTVKLINSTNAEILCEVDEEPVAVLVRYADGIIMVSGDSSTIINSVMDSPYHINNTLFVKYLMGGRELIVYEGSRLYTTVEARAIAYTLDTLTKVLSMVVEQLVGSDILKRALLFLVTVCMATVYIANKFGLSRKRFTALRNIRSGGERSGIQIENIISGASLWLKEVEK